jgi:hypothetical protein
VPLSRRACPRFSVRRGGGLRQLTSDDERVTGVSACTRVRYYSTPNADGLARACCLTELAHSAQSVEEAQHAPAITAEGK